MPLLHRGKVGPQRLYLAYQFLQRQPEFDEDNGAFQFAGKLLLYAQVL